MRALISLFAVLLITGSAAGQERIEERRSGAIETGGARAAFELQLEAGEIVTLSTIASDLDTVLTLNGPDGAQVAENDDQASGVLTSRIVHVAGASGAYTAIVTGYG
ncbi:MAG TPA: hypothetical protein PLS69_13830, partial [Terricaulis sp.]|nr:hypothetical protein [Terricaulis sp.]